MNAVSKASRKGKVRESVWGLIKPFCCNLVTRRPQHEGRDLVVQVDRSSHDGHFGKSVISARRQRNCSGSLVGIRRRCRA